MLQSAVMYDDIIWIYSFSTSKTYLLPQPSIKGSVWSKKSFPFFAKNMIIKSILNLWWHSKILKLFLGVVRGIFTKRVLKKAKKDSSALVHCKI